MCRQRVSFQHLFRRTLKHYFTPFTPGAGTNVHNVVGGQHHVLVVLNHNDGVTKVAQFLERTDEALVITLVKTNGRLVENIKHVDQL